MLNQERFLGLQETGKDFLDFNNTATNLEFYEGVWYAKEKSKVFYPKEGNERIFQIEENSFWFRHRNNCIIETVRNFRPKGVIFDIGGGNGFVSLALEKNGFKTVLVEAGENGILNAKKRGLKNLICSTFQDAGFLKGSLPAIGVFDVAEHIKDDQKFFSELKDSLMGDGRIYLTIPAYTFLYSYEDQYAGHLRRYTLKNMHKILEQAGFKVEYSTYIFTILPVPIFFFRTLPSKMGIKRKSLKECIKEHGLGEGIVNRYFLENIWQKELGLIKKKKRIPFGGTCLIVAKK